MKPLFILLAAILLFSNTVFVCKSQTAKSETGIEFEISLQDSSKIPVEGDEIYIAGVFKNVSTDSRTIAILDYELKPNQPKRKLKYPIGLFAKAVDSSGKVLTENTSFSNGWWTSDCDGGAFYLLEELGEVVTLKPSEKVTRVIPLNSLLRECFASPKSEDLPAGRNTIQLRLNNLVSNKLEIEVKKKTP